MASSKKFWIFSDAFCFFGFFTQILYNLVPTAFIFQLKNGVLVKERLSFVGILCLYGTAFIYFFQSLKRKKEGDDIDPLDFCNLIGAYLGFIYLFLYIYYLYFKTNKKLGIILILGLTLISLGVFLWIYFTVDSEDNAWKVMFDWAGVVFNIFENLPLGFSIIYLIKNKVSEKFTLFGAFFGLINESTWLAWALNATIINHNNLYHSIVANSLGICIHLTQFFIYCFFKKNDTKVDSINNSNDKNINTESENNENDNSMSSEDFKTESTDPEYIKDLL